jgi:hypothetical protein
MSWGTTSREPTPPAVTAFADLTGWAEAIDRLHTLVEARGDQLRRQAESYAARYQGRRAAMVFDVVLSRRRTYTAQVLPLVDRFTDTPAAASLADLADVGVPPGLGLMTGQAETIQTVAPGMVRYCERYGVKPMFEKGGRDVTERHLRARDVVPQLVAAGRDVVASGT